MKKAVTFISGSDVPFLPMIFDPFGSSEIFLASLASITDGSEVVQAATVKEMDEFLG